MNRSTALACALAAAAALIAGPGPARASEADAFENKIPPISGQLYRKAGRFEITPELSLSLNDAFFNKILFGGKVTYHLLEFLSVGASYETGTSSTTSSTLVCPPNQGCSDATAAQLAAVPGLIRSKAGIEAGFTPIYAKLNILAEKVIHFDLSLHGGADWIRYRKVLPPPANPAAAVSPGDDNAFGGHAGVGARVFFAEWGALRLEINDYFYFIPINGQTKLQQQLFFEMGLSVFLPFSNRRP